MSSPAPTPASSADFRSLAHTIMLGPLRIRLCIGVPSREARRAPFNQMRYAVYAFDVKMKLNRHYGVMGRRAYSRMA